VIEDRFAMDDDGKMIADSDGSATVDLSH